MSSSGKKAYTLRRRSISTVRVRENKPKNNKVNKPKATPKDSSASGRIHLWAVGVVFTLLFVALWGRAFQLQVIMHDDLAKKASRQHTARQTVVGVRGSILDRNGNILARSIDSSSVWANPQEIKEKNLTVNVLSKILETDPVLLSKLINRDKKFIWVARKVNDTVAKQIKEAALPGIYLDSEFDRVYPYKTLAGQLLGFVNVDDKGIEGLEKGLDSLLSASTAKHVVQRDAGGRLLGGTSNDMSDLKGSDVTLSIDAQVQFFAEEALAENVDKYEAKWGGCIVVDVPTGEVLAWAQYPFFDPNTPRRFAEGIRRNRIATDALEQGSTIKPFLIASALEEKVVTPATQIDCEKGQWKVGKSIIHDTHSYAVLPVKRIMHVSSNIGVAKIGAKVGAKKYHEYLRKLGFGQQTDLPLAGESSGILRDAQKWQEIDLATASFGQSFSTTLVQMAKAYLCLASEGVMRDLKLTIPRSVSGRDIVTEGLLEKDVFAEKNTDKVMGEAESISLTNVANQRVFSSETMKQVRSMLREVVEEDGGTGKQARIPGMIVGGKTGTAQKAIKGKYGKGRVASFVGMVPTDKPRYLICVLLDEPAKNQYGGVVAAPVFRNVALRTMAYHGLLPDSDDPLVIAMAEKEEERRQLLAKKSGKIAMEHGQVTVVSKIAKEKNVASAPTPQKQNNSKIHVPDLVGIGPSKAIELLIGHGVVPEFQGRGSIVVKQMPNAGSLWSLDAQQCILWLGEKG